MAFRIDFWKILVVFLAPKSIKSRPKNDQKTIQNRSKIIPKLKSRWEGLLTRIFSPFYMFFRAQDGPDIPKMAPQRRQDGSQDVAKTLPRPPRSSQDPSKTVQDAFKTAQDEPKTLQEAFKSRQDRQNDPQDTSKTRIWRILGAKMEACWHQNRIKSNFLSERAKSLLVLETLLFFQ